MLHVETIPWNGPNDTQKATLQRFPLNQPLGQSGPAICKAAKPAARNWGILDAVASRRSPRQGNGKGGRAPLVFQGRSTNTRSGLAFHILGTSGQFEFQCPGASIRETIGVLIFRGQQGKLVSSTLRLPNTRNDRGSIFVDNNAI